MIEATGLRKSYRTGRRGKKGTVDAVRGVDFAVQQGEIFGFLGPNGAGKSTTLRMLATLIRPDGGRATIACSASRCASDLLTPCMRACNTRSLRAVEAS